MEIGDFAHLDIQGSPGQVRHLLGCKFEGRFDFEVEDIEVGYRHMDLKLYDKAGDNL